ncbi:NAD(P)/FAD-dependent oxidoreductase [Cupriavidus necator]|uniref:FAD-dependent pyridine nucleotide-disufide oxidoreductase n=1 Tax=Cupriavidus pinatubonensis (strain JMP 134 / LMG 1197) TaxID=264198 RepID=Q46NN1_CUPPJ|nr:FAD-dependent oxidoreductase [Cupriavidus necator]
MNSGTSQQFVIIGSGQAGGWAARTLREGGFEGRIVIVGEEAHPPYERPPLSKAVLTMQKPAESCYLWSMEKLGELNIDTIQGSRATAIHRDRREVELADGGRVPYDRLLIATGARPRRLNCPGADLTGVHYLRTIEDSERIRASLSKGGRLLVVGGGWIGLEVAASAISMGVPVTLVEATDRLCGRSLPESLGRFFMDLHVRHGVEIHLNASLTRLEGNGRVERAVFGNGDAIEVTTVVVGIGVVPNTELAADCGLPLENGIVVNESACTADPSIFAAGDVANQPSSWLNGRVRFESWKNAQDHGVLAASAMLGGDTTGRDIPWFWSDQYDVNFQLLGIPSAGNQVYQKGDASSGRFTQYFVQNNHLTAVAAVNSPRDLRDAKRSMQSQSQFDTTGLVPVPAP